MLPWTLKLLQQDHWSTCSGFSYVIMDAATAGPLVNFFISPSKATNMAVSDTSVTNISTRYLEVEIRDHLLDVKVMRVVLEQFAREYVNSAAPLTLQLQPHFHHGRAHTCRMRTWSRRHSTIHLLFQYCQHP